MSFKAADIKKIAHLAKLNLSEEDLLFYTPQLSRILDFIEQMKQVDTSKIEPMAHPLALAERLREDRITETNQRAKFEAIAPQVEAGLYLVPRVIDEIS